MGIRLSDRMFEITGHTPKKGSNIANAIKRKGVVRSMEFERILALPRRVIDLSTVVDLTDVWRVDGECSGCEFCCEGTPRLRPIQSAALFDAEKADGLLACVGVGFGKTVISLLLPDAMKSKKAVLLVKPRLRDQLLSVDIPKISRHFRLPLKNLKIVAYSELSDADKGDVLEREQPDLIIADECHSLRHRDAVRTRRFLKYFKEHPECRFAGLSGTIANNSLHDFAHLSELALRKNSPLPFGYMELKDWAEAIDVSDDPMPPGVLRQFCIAERATTQGEVREGFRRRLVETQGVVATEISAVGTSLVISARLVELPNFVNSLLTTLRRTWALDEEEFSDAKDIGRVARQLACGFYYRWAWPNNEKDYDWLEARRDWHREVREKLKRASSGMDSPLLLARAAAAGRWQSETWARWDSLKTRYRPQPPIETVWVSDFLVQDAVRWGCEEAGIIWYEHDALGTAIAKASGFPFFGPGKEGDAIINANPSTMPVIIASIRAHGDGKNLQAYSKNLITTPPANGTTWEQMCGRTHRPGQKADEVTVDVYMHDESFRHAIEEALKDAAFIEQAQGQPQKLNYATKIGLS